MRFVNLKAGPTGALTIAHPSAMPGEITRGKGSRAQTTIIYRIIDVPDDVTDAKVRLLADQTVLAASLYDGAKPSRGSCVYEFSKLGPGRILREAAGV